MGLSSSQPPKIETATLIQSDYFTKKPSLAAIAFEDKQKTALIAMLPESGKTRFIQSQKDWFKLLKEKLDFADLLIIVDFQLNDVQSILEDVLLLESKKIFFLKDDLFKTKFDCVIYGPTDPAIPNQFFTVKHKHGLVEQIQLEEKDKDLEFIR